MADDWLEAPVDLSGKRIWIAGHKGLVGSAIYRRLQNEACEILVSDIDLREQALVRSWLEEYGPEIVILAAAKVGGIIANSSYPAEFLYDNMMIEANVIHGAYEAGVEKLLFLGSSCIYPKGAAVPISEDALLSGSLEPSNAPYALAKIAGVKLCETYRTQYGCDFISLMPCNLYGPGDRFDVQNSHVIPALMMRAQEAKENHDDQLVVWGSGAPLREFLYVDDLADGCVFALTRYSDARPLNIGSGQEISIAKLAQTLCEVVGYSGELVFDKSKPDGVQRKVIDSSRILNAGWSARMDLREGLIRTYDWFLEHNAPIKKVA